MGRLFRKFFLFIWLAQLAGMLGVGAIFWLEHHRDGVAREIAAQAGGEPHHHGPPPVGGPPAVDHPHGPPSGFDHPYPPGKPPRENGPHIPLLPFLAALLASFACAIVLAWYFAKPIRRLRAAFDAAADGNLDVRIGHDMDGRRDELADLGRDFDRMTERLRLLMDGQRRLLHDVSHEMRSPLARLQAAIGLARQQPLRLEDSLGRIEREGERMNSLVGELLTLSRLDAGVTGVQESVDMTELLNNIVEDARFEGSARDVRIDFVAGEMLELRANAELLHRAIENVVRNALRYSPAGATVRIEAGMAGRVFRIGVMDQGAGVSEAELERIFDPFFRGDGVGDGYGLGLAIARRVITALGGRIRAANRVGGGLLVEIVLEMP